MIWPSQGLNPGMSLQSSCFLQYADYPRRSQNEPTPDHSNEQLINQPSLQTQSCIQIPGSINVFSDNEFSRTQGLPHVCLRQCDSIKNEIM